MTGPATMWAGTVSTAGGVVFSGDDDGNLIALDSQSGKHLWHFFTGHTLWPCPSHLRPRGSSMSPSLPRRI